jgi:hypothetical protein
MEDSMMQAADPVTQAEGIVERQKEAGASQADRMAKAVHGAADDLQEQMPKAAELVHAAASQLEKGADALRKGSVGDLLAGVNDFGRKEPLALFGAAIMAGFAATRFLKSSADKSR